jgi:hypothetical protein
MSNFVKQYQEISNAYMNGTNKNDIIRSFKNIQYDDGKAISDNCAHKLYDRLKKTYPNVGRSNK